MGCNHFKFEDTPVNPAMPIKTAGVQQHKKGTPAVKRLVPNRAIFFSALKILKDLGQLDFPAIG